MENYLHKGNLKLFPKIKETKNSEFFIEIEEKKIFYIIKKKKKFHLDLKIVACLIPFI